MVISSDSRTFQSHIAIQFHFFACDTASICYSLSNSSVTHRKSLNFFQSLTLICYCSIQNILSQLNKVSVLSNEVSLAFQSDYSAKAIGNLYKYTTFRSFTIRTFCSNCLSLFTNNLHCTVEIAISFSQRILTVHHTSSGHFAQLGYISHCYSHNIFLF